MAAPCAVLVVMSLVRFAAHGSSPFATVPRQVGARFLLVNHGARKRLRTLKLDFALYRLSRILGFRSVVSGDARRWSTEALEGIAFRPSMWAMNAFERSQAKDLAPRPSLLARIGFSPPQGREAGAARWAAQSLYASGGVE